MGEQNTRGDMKVLRAQFTLKSAEAGALRKERDDLRAEVARLKDELEDAKGEWQPTFLRDVNPEKHDCPTWYDGCRCTSETLVYNINRAEKAEAEVARLTRERDEAVKSLEHSRQWWGVRFERLGQWAREELTGDLRKRYFSISANGTADWHEHPTYAQQMNLLRFRAEKAERERDTLNADVERLIQQRDLAISVSLEDEPATPPESPDAAKLRHRIESLKGAVRQVWTRGDKQVFDMLTEFSADHDAIVATWKEKRDAAYARGVADSAGVADLEHEKCEVSAETCRSGGLLDAATCHEESALVAARIADDIRNLLATPTEQPEASEECTCFGIHVPGDTECPAYVDTSELLREWEAQLEATPTGEQGEGGDDE